MSKLRKATIELAYRKPELRKDLLPVLAAAIKLPPGFKGFDDPDLPPGFEGFETVETKRSVLDEAKTAIGEHPDMLDGSRLLKPTALRTLTSPAVYYFRRNRKWMVETDATSEGAAKKLGLRAQKNLVGKRSLSASDPYLHDIPLVVVWSDGWAELPPLPKKAPAPKKGPNLTQLKRDISKKGQDFFGARGFSLSGKEGAYTVTFRPYLKKFRGIFGKVTIGASTLEEVGKKLDEAIAKIEGFMNQ